MSNENTQNLAEKIANLLQSESQNGELSSLHASIEKINNRLEKIEVQLSSNNPKPKIQNPKSNHPSRQKYNVVEAIVDEVFENMQEEKSCTFEPNGKPCDHCSMCNSHGF